MWHPFVTPKTHHKYDIHMSHLSKCDVHMSHLKCDTRLSLSVLLIKRFWQNVLKKPWKKHDYTGNNNSFQWKIYSPVNVMPQGEGADPSGFLQSKILLSEISTMSESWVSKDIFYHFYKYHLNSPWVGEGNTTRDLHPGKIFPVRCPRVKPLNPSNLSVTLTGALQ